MIKTLAKSIREYKPSSIGSAVCYLAALPLWLPQDLQET